MSRKIEISKKRLENLYVYQKLSTNKIAKILNCERTAVSNRLKEYKIKTRQPKNKIIIPKETLERLYLDKKLSTQKIADALNISSCCVYYKLKELNITLRKKKNIPISKKKLKSLYINKKLSCAKIAKIYNCDAVTIFEKLKRHKIMTRNLSKSTIKYSKEKFNGNKVLMAYMIGFRLGDLNVKAVNNNATVIIKSCTTKQDQLKLIKKVYGLYGHFWVKTYNKTYNIICLLDSSFNFLIKKENKIEEWIMKNDNYFLAFLGGYTDAEGNFGVYQNRARFRLGTYEKNILLQIQKKLISLGILTKFRLEKKAGNLTNKKDFYRISINQKDSLLNFIRLMEHYLEHEKRYKDMQKCKKNILERNKKYQSAIHS